ncbi:hypothetical protein [Alicyclobacillus fodiniaquatilis]|uniref:Uncharacterized protein n=1 Tax=Alicyclobacillus fodiniaquatilis TaxID=1661150 RepID=A0ABW4JJ01_9BACL
MEINENEKYYNPYEDKSLHQLQAEEEIVDELEPFNDAVKYNNLIFGHRQNRPLSDYPKRARRKVKIWSIVILAWVIAGVLLRLYVLFFET